MKYKKKRYFACDFETTVYQGQDHTEVWLSGAVELYTEKPVIFHDIGGLFDYFKSLDSNVIAYFHNLKFDGSFWIWYLLHELKYSQAYKTLSLNPLTLQWCKNSEMKSKSFKYSISDNGLWYTILIKVGKHYIELRDSYKLLPYSIENIGKSFDTKHRKTSMRYDGYRYAGCKITEEEKEYFYNDLFVLKEGLEIMFDEGHTKLTAGSNAFSEYKEMIKHSSKIAMEWDELFPPIYETYFNDIEESAGEYVRKSYKGGWTYLVKGKENKVIKNGYTADVNSLYPSVMHSKSGNKYPIGYPCYWTGEIPEKAKESNKYYFVRIKTRFYIKDGKLPFIQIKNSLLYKRNECLESSDVYDRKTGKYYTHYYDNTGQLRDTRVEMVLTCTDYELFLEHYNVVDFEIIDGMYFYAISGIFDEYIDHFMEIKMNSTGAKRALAKLFLNSLYGKFATSTDSSFKVAYIKEDGSLGYKGVEEHNKKPGYIPVGSAVTSYARNFTIRRAQANFYGKNKKGFIYADTDSIHFDLPLSKLKNIDIHPSDLLHWKIESTWDEAIFVRQKTYIEHNIQSDLKDIEPYYNIKCAGMPKKCKDLFNWSLLGKMPDGEELSDEGWNFLIDSTNMEVIKRDLSDFKKGLKIPDKLMPRNIKGGILLKSTTFEML